VRLLHEQRKTRRRQNPGVTAQGVSSCVLAFKAHHSLKILVLVLQRL